MLRLLYLLIRQRVGRDRGDNTVPGRYRPRRSRALVAASAIVLVCGVAVAIVLTYPRFLPVPLSPVDSEAASLELRVAAVDSPPLVIFLESPRLLDGGTVEPGPATVRITSIDNAFEPAFQVAPLSATIEVRNADPIPHNTHLFDRERTVFNVATPVPGVRVRKVLAQPGVLGVRCDLHPWMRAWVFVPPNPHYAVFWKPGSVTLRDIAPGWHRVHAWESGRGETTRTLSLGAGETHRLSYPGG